MLTVTFASSAATAAQCPNVHIVLYCSGLMTSFFDLVVDVLPVRRDPDDQQAGGSGRSAAREIGLAQFPNAGCDSLLSVRPDYSTAIRN